MKTKILVSLLVFPMALTLSGQIQGQNNSSPIVLRWEEGMESPQANLEIIQWLEGNWVGDLEGDNQQHVAFPIVGKNMPGYARGWKDNGDVLFYEVSVFTEIDHSIEFRVKHVSGDLSVWEGEKGYARHRLIKYTEKEFYFDNITYTKVDDNTHIVHVRIPNGEPEGRIITIVQKRVAPSM